MAACRDWSSSDCRCHGSWTWCRCSCNCLLAPLRLLLVLLMSTCCCSQWLEKPQDASQRLDSHVTFNCTAAADSVYMWKKDGSVTLFFNTDSWNANITRRMRADAMPRGGVSLTVSSLERSDDGQYTCEISQSGLMYAATARLTVLGMSLSLSLSVGSRALSYI